VKRLLLACVVAGAALTGAAPANATIVTCDSMPVMARCFWMGGRKWCDLYVAARPVVCVQAGELIGPLGA
jgi:hypothetical protein